MNLNNTIQEPHCSFEVSKLLKEKGFQVPTINAYIGDTFFSNKVDLSYSDFSGYERHVEIDEFPENWNKPEWVFTKDGSECFGCALDNKKYFEACSVPTRAIAIEWMKQNFDKKICENPNGGYDAFDNIDGKYLLIDKFPTADEAIIFLLKNISL